MSKNNNTIDAENIIEETTAIATKDEIIEARRESGFAPVSTEDFASPSAKQMYISMAIGDSMADKAKLFNAVNSPDESLSEHIGEVISLKDIIAHPIQLVDENTGEVIDAMRVILVSDNGTTYAAVSNGIANAIQRILSIFGQPNTWSEPVKVKAIQKQTRNGNNKVTTLKIEM